MFSMPWHQKKIQFPCLPKPLKTPLFTLFSPIFPCANAAGQLKHIYKKSFKNIVAVSVFTMFSVKNALICTFFGIKSVQNTCFCNVFNALASKNLSKYRYLQCFFIFVRFSIAGSLPKWPKIPFQYRAQKPKNRRRISQTPPNSGLGAKSCLGPPVIAFWEYVPTQRMCSWHDWHEPTLNSFHCHSVAQDLLA